MVVGTMFQNSDFCLEASVVIYIYHNAFSCCSLKCPASLVFFFLKKISAKLSRLDNHSLSVSLEVKWWSFSSMGFHFIRYHGV